MTTSDLIALYGIVIAIIALISEKNREYIFLKFSRMDFVFLLLFFVFIHYLISFDWFLRVFPSLSFFYCKYCPTSNGWAYILTIIILAWLLLKIYKADFPFENREKLINYYESQILEGNYSFLVGLIKKYHIDQIVEYLKALKEIKVRNTGLWVIDQQEYLKEFKNKINTKKMKYGNNLLSRIIKNNDFVVNVANTYPYLFTGIISEMDKDKVKDPEFVNLYLKVLIKSKNRQFFNELRNVGNFTKFRTYEINQNTPILYSFFHNIRVAQLNQVWRAIGEQAIMEMEEEAKKAISPLRDIKISNEDDILWNYRIQNAIHFFDIMVRQAIKDSDYHMWLLYYWYFIKSILKNIPEINKNDATLEKWSRNHHLIEKIILNSSEWIQVIIQLDREFFVNSITDCIAKCVFEIAVSKKLTDEAKLYLINITWEEIIELPEEDGNKGVANKMINAYFEALTKQINFINDVYKMKEYARIIMLVYDKRDIAKFTSELQRERINKFQKEVVEKLKKKVNNWNTF